MGEKNLSINKIQMVKVTQKSFLPDDNGCTRVEEFYSDGYVRYRLEKGSRKKTDKKEIQVLEQEMQLFFDKLYNFVREADEEVILMDDHYTRIEFVYSPYHKEIFDEAATCRDGDTLIHQIGKFIMAHEDM